jgi:DNA modification methylase
MHVVCGNHTFRAACELGWPEINAHLLDIDEDAELRLLLVDNRANDCATFDFPDLTVLLAELAQNNQLLGTGFDQASLEKLLDQFGDGVTLGADDVPPLPDEPTTRPGELIELGAHRLLCGDAANPTSHARVLDGEAAALLWTDPPYGVDYTGKTPARLQLRNDSCAGIAQLVGSAFACADAVLIAGAPLYICHPAGRQLPLFLDAFLAQGWDLRQGLVWRKDTMVLGHGDYHYAHEPILYGFKPGPGRLGRGGNGWYGDNKQVSVLDVPRPRCSREHPTMKPPELIATALRNSSRRGDIVLDPFAGSGSTLVACEQLGRQARLIELDPRYCDVVVERFEQLTGTEARRGGR